MHPSELLPHAEHYPADNPGAQNIVDGLAASISRIGYKPAKYSGAAADPNLSTKDKPSSPIRLVHEDWGSYLRDGNHRVHALNRAGYDKKVPVSVLDRRRRRP